MAWALLLIAFGVCVGFVACLAGVMVWLIILDRRDNRVRR